MNKEEQNLDIYDTQTLRYELLHGRKPNQRATNEYLVVTDGEQLFRLAYNMKMPKGLEQIITHEGKCIYLSNGRLKPMFASLQRVAPRNNMTLLSRSIKYALQRWA